MKQKSNKTTRSAATPTANVAGGVTAAENGAAGVPVPSWAGAPVIARYDPNLGFTKANVYIRSALSEEEAQAGEVYVGAALRARVLEIEQEGWAKIDHDFLELITELDESPTPLAQDAIPTRGR